MRWNRTSDTTLVLMRHITIDGRYLAHDLDKRIALNLSVRKKDLWTVKIGKIMINLILLGVETSATICVVCIADRALLLQ